MFNKGLFFTILFAAVILSGSLVFLGMRTVSSDDIKAAVIDGLNEFVVTGPQPPAAEDSDNVVGEDFIDDAAVLGDFDAPVTIVEFSEFQCPYCIKFYNGAYQDIKDNYIDNGKVKLVFKHFPLDFHAGAYPAALATECVREQGGDEMFFAMHDKIFEDNSVLSGSEDSIKEGLAAYAREVGANMSKYESCVESDRYEDEINNDVADGRNSGVSGTPSFVINGELIVGAQPFSVFESAIERALAE